jgi:hypothetical protein
MVHKEAFGSRKSVANFVKTSAEPPKLCVKHSAFQQDMRVLVAIQYAIEHKRKIFLDWVFLRLCFYLGAG